MLGCTRACHVAPRVRAAEGVNEVRLGSTRIILLDGRCDSGPAWPGRASGRVMVRRPEAEAPADDPGDAIDAIVG